MSETPTALTHAEALSKLQIDGAELRAILVLRDRLRAAGIDRDPAVTMCASVRNAPPPEARLYGMPVVQGPVGITLSVEATQ